VSFTPGRVLSAAVAQQNVKPLGFCTMGTLQQLQQWYQAHCDGEWEHAYGVEIGTLDNPGWSVRIDLVATPLAKQAFTEIKRLENDTNGFVVAFWMASSKAMEARICLRRF
jgi:hypothetical protein